MLLSMKQELFFYCSEVIEVYSHPLICPLLCPNVSAKRIHYCEKMLRLTNFIDLVSCAG